MGCAKTLHIITVAYNYELQNKSVILLAPAFDSRFGVGNLTSRAGLSRKADHLLNEETDLVGLSENWQHISCILVDEVHFLPESVIDQLRHIATYKNIPVICYGLRSSYRNNLFPGSKRLFELADNLEELKATCQYCNRKASTHIKLDALHDHQSPDIVLGDDVYRAVCFHCYFDRLPTAAKALLHEKDYQHSE